MDGQRIRTVVFAASITALSGAALAAAQSPQTRSEPTMTAADERIARLEALIDAQNRRLDDLRQQLHTVATQDIEQARTDAIKEQIRAVLNEREFRESLIPGTLAAGYDGGFYLRGADDKFLMKFNGAMQMRYVYYNSERSNRYTLPGQQRDDRSGFELTRIRFSLSGNVYSPDLTYYLQLGSDASGAYDTGLYYAWANYRFNDAFQVKLGIFDLASTRHTFNDDFAQHFVDRPLFDAVYGLGTGLGMRFWGQLFDKRLEYFIDVVNSTADGENVALSRPITSDPSELDGNPAILAALTWHALGENPPNDFAGESDLEFHKTPAIDLGVHYAFNDDQGDLATTRLPFPLPRGAGQGGFGLTATNGIQFHQFGTHVCAKWEGLSLIGEYALRVVDPRRAGRRPFTPFWLLTGEDSTVAQHGGILSVGYFLPIPGLEKKFEIVGRVGGISTTAEGHEGVWEYGAGVNYYLQGQGVKLQADVTKVSESPISAPYSSLANVNDDALIFRVQLQVAF